MRTERTNCAQLEREKGPYCGRQEMQRCDLGEKITNAMEGREL